MSVVNLQYVKMLFGRFYSELIVGLFKVAIVHLRT